MVSATVKSQHEKKILAGNDDCQVIYCQECNVLELNLGALTLRLNPESLRTLGSVLNHAKVRLDRLQNKASDREPLKAVSSGHVH